MTWLKHPKFIRVRDSVLKALTEKERHFRKINSVIFLCGGRSSKPRERLSQYISSQAIPSLIFSAEDVWTILAKQAKFNALEMEEQLAQLADLVIIIVESPGTYTELGAFSLSESLRKKLLPILDPIYAGDGSFIETGPIRWVDSDSDFSPSIWVNLNTILDASPEIDDRLGRLSKPSMTRITDLSKSPKHLLYFICELAGIFGPCPIDHIQFYVKEIIGEINSDQISLLTSLANAMNLINSLVSSSGESLFYQPLSNGKLITYRLTPYFTLPSLRAKVLSVMQTIGPANEAIKLIVRGK